MVRVNLLKVNHWWTKTEPEFGVKLRRGPFRNLAAVLRNPPEHMTVKEARAAGWKVERCLVLEV